MSLNSTLVRRLKEQFKVKQDRDLAEIFNVSPFMFSAWKRSKGRLIEEVVKYGVKNHLDFNKIFYNEEVDVKKKPVLGDPIPVVMANDLFEYSLDPNKVINRLFRYSFPKTSSNNIGFQIISQNMEPTIMVSSIVLGEAVLLENLRVGDVYVLHTTTKGIYVSRFLRERDTKHLFVNDNSLYEDVEFTKEEIINVFKVDGVFSDL